MSEHLADEVVTDPQRYPVQSSRTANDGRIVSVWRDDVAMCDGSIGQRDVVVHPGSVGVIALDDDRVVLIRHPVRSYLYAREPVERYRNASAKADSLCCRWPWKAFPSGQTAAAVRESWPWVRRCPCEGEIEIRWVLLEPSRVRRAESGTRGLPADADRAPIRFPRRARLYV